MLNVAPGAVHLQALLVWSKVALVPQSTVAVQTPFFNGLSEGQAQEYLFDKSLVQDAPLGVLHLHSFPSWVSEAPGPHVQVLSVLNVAPGAVHLHLPLASSRLALLPQSTEAVHAPFLRGLSEGHEQEYLSEASLVQVELVGVLQRHSEESWLKEAPLPQEHFLLVSSNFAPGALHLHLPAPSSTASVPQTTGAGVPFTQSVPCWLGTLPDGHLSQLELPALRILSEGQASHAEPSALGTWPEGQASHSVLA